MDSFYIITNILKDKDYAVTDKICNYIEQKGKKWTLAKKDEEGHILPGTVPSDVECGLVLGGDGTLIRAIRVWKVRNSLYLGSTSGHWDILQK